MGILTSAGDWLAGQVHENLALVWLGFWLALIVLGLAVWVFTRPGRRPRVAGAAPSARVDPAPAFGRPARRPDEEPEIRFDQDRVEALLCHREAELNDDIDRLAADREACALLEEVREIVREKRRDLHSVQVDLTERLVRAYRALGDFREHFSGHQLAQAREALERGDPALAEALFKLALDRGTPEAARAYHFLGLLAEGRLDYVAAMQYYYQSATLQPQNPDYQSAAGELAFMLWHFPEAERLLRRSLELKEKFLGSEHPELAQILNNLGALHFSMDNYDQAAALYQWSLEISEKSEPPGQPNPVLLENYAALLKKMGRDAEAEAMEARAAQIRAAEQGLPPSPS